MVRATNIAETCSMSWCQRKETDERRKPVGAVYSRIKRKSDHD